MGAEMQESLTKELGPVLAEKRVEIGGNGSSWGQGAEQDGQGKDTWTKPAFPQARGIMLYSIARSGTFTPLPRWWQGKQQYLEGGKLGVGNNRQWHFPCTHPRILVPHHKGTVLASTYRASLHSQQEMGQRRRMPQRLQKDLDGHSACPGERGV